MDLERLIGRRVLGPLVRPADGRGHRRSVPSTAAGSRTFSAPAEGDWVLVLDDETKRYGPPGGRLR